MANDTSSRLAVAGLGVATLACAAVLGAGDETNSKDKQASEALGSGLRQGSRNSLRRRRGIFGLFLAASASMSVIALYQLGILKRVPEPPLSRFASGDITGSAKAYSLLATPDAVLAMGSYAATMTLAAMGLPDRANEQPLLPIALAAKVGFKSPIFALTRMNTGDLR